MSKRLERRRHEHRQTGWPMLGLASMRVTADDAGHPAAAIGRVLDDRRPGDGERG